ncbi:MAG: ATP-binding protein [Solirubrobacteraceae bacterium]|nr:histidine kinase [Patulibacter sp.]
MPTKAPREQSVAGAVALFALTGLIVLVLLGFAAVEVLRSSSTAEAIRDAKVETTLAGRAVIGPAIQPGLAQGDPVAQEAMRKAAESYVLGGTVVRLKLWDEHGKIIWSDEPGLIGTSYPLGDDETEALEHSWVDAEVSDLTRPENRYERRYGKLLEVYRGITAPDGTHYLFETYRRSSTVEASATRLWERFLPALAFGLIVLELVQIPLAYLLARRLRDRQRERSALLERAIDASESERRSIAAALHDGPVQQLAGIAFSLAATARRIGEGPMRSTLEEAAAGTRATMRDLRSSLVDLYPATLHRSGLAAALQDLLAPLQDAGVTVSLEAPPSLELPEFQEALLFRAAREAVQNVRKHAEAASVSIEIAEEPHRVTLSVTDDGRGFDQATAAAHGHFGLMLLGDLAADGGGVLTIQTAPGEGTTIRLEVPT